MLSPDQTERRRHEQSSSQANTLPATADKASAGDWRQKAGRDRRVVRTVDLTDEEIAAIEASEMEPGFEHLNAELDDG
ncbi:hypothetical protein V4R08_17645 (plasmid) [Nitrobacter sp. NHB1]|uniref:hypothetical protein n=1 Tax=Nitrobacter sp. NHB1 TaxID=3119830 RepID=UPI002FFEE23C